MKDGRSQRIADWLVLYGVSVFGALVLSVLYPLAYEESDCVGHPRLSSYD